MQIALERLERPGGRAEFRAVVPLVLGDPAYGLGLAEKVEIAEAAICRAAGNPAEPNLAPQLIDVSIRSFSNRADQRILLNVLCLSESAAASQWRVDIHDAAYVHLAEITATVVQTPLQTRPQSATADSGNKHLRLAADASARKENGEQANNAKSDRLTIAEERIEQIIKGAYDVILRKGFANATTREIAEAAGMPTPTMYQYIRSKDDLLPMIFKHFAGRLALQYSENLSRSTDIVRTLADAVQKYLEYCEKNRRFINFIYRETRNITKERRDELFALDRSFTNSWAEILQAGKKSGAFKIGDPKIVAELIYFLCTIWAIRYWSLSAFPKSVVAENIMQFVLQGAGADRGALPVASKPVAKRKLPE
ncbi:MAG: TetR/AcrR family transcriptional regulator [Alphaproteobacteria bacterium]